MKMATSINGNGYKDAKEEEATILRRRTPSADKNVTHNRTDSVKPKEYTIKPIDESIRPKDESIRPKDESIRPKDESIRPKDESIRPKEDTPKSDTRPARPKEESVKPTQDKAGPMVPDDNDELAELDDKLPSMADQMEKRKTELKRESSHEARSGNVNRCSRIISNDQALGFFYYNRRSQVFETHDLDELDKKIIEANFKRR